MSALASVSGYAKNVVNELHEVGNIVLHGSTGTGKTHLAVATLKHCVQAGMSGRFVQVRDLFNALRAAAFSGGNGRFADGPMTATAEVRLLNELAGVDVLVLDDVGKSKGNDFEVVGWHTLLDLRYQASKPTVVTTNLTMQELELEIGGPAFSRLMSQELSPPVVVEMRWEDARQIPVARATPAAEPVGAEGPEKSGGENA